MDAETIFDECVSRRGGRFELKKNNGITPLLVGGRNIGLNLIKWIKVRYPRIPYIHIDFVDNKDFNAIAFKEENLYFIGIYKDLFFRLATFFDYIMSFPEVLSFIGDSKNEIAPININFEDLKEPIRPKDEIRQSCSAALTRYAGQFLIAHELGHILHGHVDLNYKWNGIPFISEMANNDEKSDIPQLDLQTLEFDADCSATNTGIQTLFKDYENKKRLYKSLQPLYKSVDDALFLWSFSVYTVLRFMDTTKYNFDNLDKSSHPYPGIRHHYILATVSTILQNPNYLQHLGLKYQYKPKNIFAKGINEFENAIKIIKIGAVNWDSVIGIQPFPIRNTYTEEGLEHMYKLQNNWRNIRPQLEPYSIVNLPQIENLGTLEEFKRIFEKK